MIASKAFLDELYKTFYTIEDAIKPLEKISNFPNQSEAEFHAHKIDLLREQKKVISSVIYQYIELHCNNELGS